MKRLGTWIGWMLAAPLGTRYKISATGGGASTAGEPIGLLLALTKAS